MIKLHQTEGKKHNNKKSKHMCMTFVIQKQPLIFENNINSLNWDQTYDNNWFYLPLYHHHYHRHYRRHH